MWLFLTAAGLLSASLIREALRHADISITTAALWLEIDKAQFERQLAGDGHLSIKRMEKLPLKFWQWYALLLIEWFGIPPEVEKALVVDEVVVVRQHMLKMELDAVRKKERLA